MQLAGDIKDDIKAVQQMRLPWWGVLCWLAACALMVWPFYHARRLDLARPVLYSIGMLGIATTIKWRFRRHMWFWGTMTILASLHILLILVVPRTTNWIPAIVVTPFGIADLYVMLWVVSVVGKLMGGPRAADAKKSVRR